MWYLLPFIAIENLKILKINLPVQTLYLFQLLIPLILTYFVFLKKRGIHFTPIFNMLLFFIFYIILITSISFALLDLINLNSLFRQLVSLLIGFFSFITLRYIFLFSSNKQILNGILTGFIFILIFAIIDIFSGRTRIYSTFTEPSHLAYDLILVYLFIFLACRNSLSNSLLYFFLILCWILIFLGTFSGSGIIAFIYFIIVLFIYYFVNKKTKALVKTTLVGIVLFTGFYYLFFKFEQTYTFIITRGITDSLLNNPYSMPVSVTDRLQALILLFSSIKINNIGEALYFFFGSGLGSDTRIGVYLPVEIFEQIKEVKAFESYLTSFLSKVIVYTGIVGTLWYLLYLLTLFKISKKLVNKNLLPNYYAQAMILTLAFLSCYTLGPFTSIGLWFIPAFIDAKYIKLKLYENYKNDYE